MKFSKEPIFDLDTNGIVGYHIQMEGAFYNLDKENDDIYKIRRKNSEFNYEIDKALAWRVRPEKFTSHKLILSCKK